MKLRLHFIFLIAVLTAGIAGAATAPMPFVTISTNGGVVGPFGAVNASASQTAGIQEAIDSLPRVTDVFSGVGGGDVYIQSSKNPYRCFTNIVFPNYFPFCLRIHGGGFNSTILQGEGSGACTNTALFRCATNHINGLSLTNALTLFVSDMGFCHTNETQTNFLWFVSGQTFAKFTDCMFTTKGALLHGQGGYSLSYEGNYPNQPIGLVGIGTPTDNSNAQIEIEHCLFYGLASGHASGSVIQDYHRNYYVMCGSYSTALPPNNPDSTQLFTHTNLWKASQISSGAAIVVYGGGGTPFGEVGRNTFLFCGAMATVGADGVGATGRIEFRDNRNFGYLTPFSATSFHILGSDAISVNCVESYDYAIGAPNALLSDSFVTNGPAGNSVIQPNGAVLPVPIPTLRFMHSTGVSGNAESWIELMGGPVRLQGLTKAVRNAITDPLAGMEVYQSDNTPGLRVYNGSHWVKYTEANDD